MSILLVALGIALLVILISWARFNAFIAFLIVSLLMGWWLGLPVDKLSSSIKTGIGSIMGDLVILICLGAMSGKIVAESGAAQKIADTSIKIFGIKNFKWAMLLTGFIVGIPLFYNVGFVLLVPLIFSVTSRAGLPAVYTAIPMLAALSVTHGFLPPHPSPSAISLQLNADIGKVLLYGLCVAIPAMIIAGPLFATTLKKITAKPLAIFTNVEKAVTELPGTTNSFISALLPALLLLIFTALSYVVNIPPTLKPIITFFSDPAIILLFSLLIITYTLGILQKINLKKCMTFYGDAVKEVAVILLIVAGAGALKQVLVDSGVSTEIGKGLQTLSLNPLVLGWLVAAIIRVCVGSATVAGLTAAGIVAPLVLQTNANPNLMVLSIGAGSLMFSHVNDSGFWMFKEYFNLSIKQTIRSWSLMETIVSVVGLIGVLILQIVVG